MRPLDDGAVAACSASRLGSRIVSSYVHTAPPGMASVSFGEDPSVCPLEAGSGDSSMSADQPLFTASTSKPSRRTRILPQESQFGGTKTLSRSMTLCFRGCRFRREWIPSEEWIRLCRGEVTEGIV